MVNPRDIAGERKKKKKKKKKRQTGLLGTSLSIQVVRVVDRKNSRCTVRNSRLMLMNRHRPERTLLKKFLKLKHIVLF